MKCPKCKSLNVEIIGTTGKKFSMGKAILGGLMTGGLGFIFGFLGKKGKYDCRCKDCGKRFTSN